jgi:cystathionine beta-synthase
MLLGGTAGNCPPYLCIMIYNNILETIGNTPLVRLNKVVRGLPGTVCVKIETTNPGNSIKDRMALKMIEDAEASGRLQPGGTIIEGTSGNTGMGLAIAACVKGYRCIFTTTDKQSREKIDMLKAAGAEVIVCPTNVEPSDPRSYYSVAARLAREMPNSVYLNQYDNLSNRQAHYETTGPEIWEQTEGKVTHLVVGVGTGGTISGAGRYLKEQNPGIQVWGIDTYGSVFKKYHETGEFDHKEIYPYITEGIGEDILPQNVDFSVIDLFEKVTDKDGLVMTRRLAREEGILVGNSAGSAVAGLLQLKDRLKPDDVVVIICHDHASRYIGKAFNDDWMRDHGFLDTEVTLQEIINRKRQRSLITVPPHSTVAEVLERMKAAELSQMPVAENGSISGSVTESTILHHLLQDPGVRDKPVSAIMEPPFPRVNIQAPVREYGDLLRKPNAALLTEDAAGVVHIVTKYDLIQVLS